VTVPPRTISGQEATFGHGTAKETVWVNRAAGAPRTATRGSLYLIPRDAARI